MAQGRPKPNVELLLQKVAERLRTSTRLKKGIILVRASGAGGGDYALEASGREVRVLRASATSSKPLIEIIGPASQIEGVVRGQKDALRLFLAGAFRVRGDLRYFSDLALELGILKDAI